MLFKNTVAVIAASASLVCGQATEHWSPIDSPTFEQSSVTLDVGFTADGQTGWAGTGSNGAGTYIIKSVDAGVTWAVLPGTNLPNLYMATAVKDEKDVVVSGVFDQRYSLDGASFNMSTNLELNPAQDAKIIPGKKAHYALMVPKGVATSDSGKLWSTTSLQQNITIFPSRYGAFPSETTWYVNTGAFPTEQSTTREYHAVNKRVLVHKEGKSMKIAPTSNDAPVDCSVDADNCFSAQIFKTIDAGKTWNSVFMNVNQGDNIYPNGIHCFDENTCISVVEGETCRILQTVDGGKTWSESMRDTDPACSLTDVFMISGQEAWVSGGYMGGLKFEGRFWHTTDGGQTWTLESSKGMYIFSFDMTSGTSGFSVALTQASGVKLFKYNPNGVNDKVIA